MEQSVFENRRDLQIVSRLIEENSRVLDLGCGDLRCARGNRRRERQNRRKDERKRPMRSSIDFY